MDVNAKQADIFAVLGRHRLVPVIAMDNAAQADPLGEALTIGGLPVVEVTFRTSAAEASIKAFARRGQMLIGAGTVLDVDTVKKAVDAGAQFIVSPGFSQEVVGYCVDHQIPVIPGCVTPTEIQQALRFGLSAVKFFPSEAFGGIKTIKAMMSVFPQMKFMPTGGVTEKNLADYLVVPAVLACGGSWMVTRELLAAGDFKSIGDITARSVTVVKGL